MMRRLWIIPMIIMTVSSFALAELGGEAQQALARAREAARDARERYAEVVNHPDQPLWREAIREGNLALSLAPEHPEVLEFLAKTHTAVRWNSRAWELWERYLEAGGEPTGEALEQLATAGKALAYARYQRGDLQGAIEYYQQVFALHPASGETITWLGRIHFELGEYQVAREYWQEALSRGVDEATSRYFLERTESRLEHGAEASDAFYRGLEAYEAGELEAALPEFIAALQHDSQYKDAAVWAARTALESGRPDEAQRYWQRVLELDPSDERAEFFLSVAEDQARWGAEAVAAFTEGYNHYEAGELEAAAERFSAAASANADYKDAFVWAARSYQESGRIERAIDYWQRVVALDPDDSRAVYFLNLAESQRGVEREAAQAFSQGVASYQVAAFDEAQAHFERALEEDPDYAEAWAWLGRLHFDRGDFEAAAERYERALELDPESDDVRFFAEEARRLATPEPSEEGSAVTSPDDEADTGEDE